MRCPFGIDLTEEELEGLTWLNGVLKSIREQGETGRDYGKAGACARALCKIQEYCQRMHDTAHDLDKRRMQLAERVLLTEKKVES